MVRLPARVRRAKLPVGPLNSIVLSANLGLAQLLRPIEKLLESEIDSSVPDIGEDALAGSQVEPEEEATPDGLATVTRLRRSLFIPTEEVRDEERKIYRRRLGHGAPLEVAGQMTADNVKAIVSSLPFDLGVLKFSTGQGTILGEGARTTENEEVVPLSAIVGIPEIDSAEMTAALEGKRRKVVLLANVEGTEFTVLEGGAQVFASRVVRIPAILVEVRRSTELTREAFEPGQRPDWEELAEASYQICKGNCYRMLSHLEPIAEIAREVAHEVKFLQIMDGQETSEEFAARIKADDAETRRGKLWYSLFLRFRRRRMTEDQSEAGVRRDSGFRATEKKVEELREKAAALEEIGDSLREWAAEALDESAKMAAADGVSFFTPIDDSLLILHDEARKGNIPGEQFDAYKGNAVTGYLVGDEVEIRDVRGKWHGGIVVKVADLVLIVEKFSGGRRRMADPTAIRSRFEKALDLGVTQNPDGLGTLGNNLSDSHIARPSTINYFQEKLRKAHGGRILSSKEDEDMDEIRDKTTGVLIPAGSNSLRIERAVEPISAEMNETPLRVNLLAYETNLGHATRLWEELRDITRRMTGRDDFRPNASADCVEELFGRRALPIQKVSKKTGQPTCDSDVLLALASLDDDLAPAIIKARQARSILSQFEKFSPFAKAGFVQALWDQYGTPMARYTASAPNLQNRVVGIREVIEADEGWTFVSQDLGQSEYVTWASLSNDPTLSEAFLAGEDFHQNMYDKLKDVFVAQGIDTGRKAGKTVNFSLLYLMKPFSFAKRMGISQEAAQNIFDEYAAIAPQAIAYRESILEEGAKIGQVSTRFGRTRFLRDLGSKDKFRREEARKTGWHHHNAGTAAELMKIKMVKTWKALRAQGFETDRVRVALNMHDEMILKVRDDVVEQVAEIAKERFLEPIEGFLPIAVDQRIGKTWGAISK
jgi:hypothetical protein